HAEERPKGASRSTQDADAGPNWITVKRAGGKFLTLTWGKGLRTARYCGRFRRSRKRSITMAATARSFPVIREAVASFPDRADFEAALKAGAALLWVRCDDPELELRAARILEQAGGRHVHVHGRPARPAG